MNYLCIIPARLGSQRLKNKNMKIIGGKPLIFWTISLAIKCKFFSKIVVSTDSDKIKKYCKKFKLDVIDRPKNLSLNSSKMDHVINHTLDHYRKKNTHFDSIALLQPTSPLRTLRTINAACKKFNKDIYDTLVSVEKLDHKSTPDKLFRIKNFNNALRDFKYPTTQIKNYYKLDGGVIFIKKIDKFKKSLLSGKTSFIEVTYPESIDIDNLQDFIQAKYYLKSYEKN